MDHEMPDVSANSQADRERTAELKDMKWWAEELKINKPIPKDLLPILAKDGYKQMEILMKNTSLEKR
jgi:hypothetical protein